MNVTQLLNELAQQNIRLAADGAKLQIRAPKGALTPQLRDRLAEHKQAILALLRRDTGADASAALLRIEPDRENRYQPFPLTDIQQAYWVGRMAEFDQGDISIHVYAEIDCEMLDLARLNAAWQRMIERHDMLRSVVLPDGRQQILATVPPYAFAVTDLGAAEPDQAAAALAATRDELSHQVLPNDRWPAFEIRASLLPGGRTRMHISIDLVNMDGGSVMMLLDEWTRVYRDPDTALAPLALSYRDYVLGELSLRSSRSYQDSLEYWKARVHDLPPAPELPLSPQGARRTRFVHKAATIERDTWARLKGRAAERDLTASAVLAAAYAEILATWSKSADFTLNVTLFNRLPLHPEVDSILGDFTSMILLGVHGSRHTSFEARARAIQEQLWRDLEHHQVSGIHILRELAHARQQYTGAIMPVVFTNMLNLGAKGFSPLYSSLETLGEVMFILTQTPQVWLDYQVHEDAQGLRLTWDCVEELFPPGMIDDMLAAHCRLLERLAGDDALWRASRIPLVPPRQLAQREAVNATEAAVPETLLHTLFETKVPERPEQAAIIAPERTLSYAELARRMRQLGNRLRALGAAPSTLVAVVMEKGWEQVVAALGIHAAGAAYLPLDAGLPAERLRYLLEHAEVRLVVTQRRIEQRLPWPEGIVRISVDSDDLAQADDAQLAPAQQPGDLAYVIYTSGSTGVPKGVMIEQRSVVNRLLDVNRRAGVGPGDRCLALTALHHDLSVYDVFGVLAAGGTIVMPAHEARREPGHWAALIRRHRVTLWNSVPAFLEMLVEHLEHAPDRDELVPRSLRLVILAGDWIPVTLPDRLRRLCGEVQLIASGGPTETTIWDIWYPIQAVDPAWKSIPYGVPMTNTRYHVLDTGLEPCPVWVPGELYIGGVGLARGYWRDDARTRAAFITHPHTGERLYRSGDLGRYLPDGTIEFLGRDDNQVKIGGYRIELEEIEAALARHPGVRASAVVARGEHGDRHLVAYVVPEAVAPAPAVPLPEGADPALADPAMQLEFKMRRLGVRTDLSDRPALPLPGADDAWLPGLGERRSQRAFPAQPITLASLGQLLAALYSREIDGLARHAYPSAGSLYPVQVFVHIKPGRVEGADGGIYYYHPVEHRLVLLFPGARIHAATHAEVNRAAFESSAFSIFLVGELRAIEPLYGVQARDFCLLEAGYMSQLLATTAPRCGLGLCPIGGVDASVRELLGLGDTQILLHSHVGGGALAHAHAGASRPGAPEPVTPAALREHLRARLPEPMVPAIHVVLPELPLTSNGKIDRKALAARQPDAPAAEPMTPSGPLSGLEETIAAIVTDVLGRPVGAGQNFFDLGATSVHIVRIAGRLRDALGRTIQTTELFRCPTVTALAAHLCSSAGEGEALRQARGRVEARLAARSRRGRGS